MIRRKGIGGFVGNSLHWIKGVFKPSYSKTSAFVLPPTRSDGFASIIVPDVPAVLSRISLAGQSYLSTINASIGLSCIIHNTSKGVLSNINETGQGVISSES